MVDILISHWLVVREGDGAGFGTCPVFLWTEIHDRPRLKILSTYFDWFRRAGRDCLKTVKHTAENSPPRLLNFAQKRLPIDPAMNPSVVLLMRPPDDAPALAFPRRDLFPAREHYVRTNTS